MSLLDAILTLALFQSPSPSPLARGQQAFRVKDWTSAERWFVEALRARPTAEAHKWLGMTYAAQEKFLLAEAPFRRACELSPREPDACYYLARTLFVLSRFPESLRLYERLAAAEPKSGRILLGTALVLEALGRDGDARSFFERAAATGDKQAAVDFEKFRRKAAVPAEAAPEVRFVPSDLAVTVRNGASGNKHLVETMIAGVAVFDYDNDGWLDIFVSNGAALPSLTKTGPEFHNALLRNNRDGAFTNVTQQAGLAGEGYSMGPAAADYDNDGHTDLFLTGAGRQFLYRNRGDGTFEDVTARAGLDQRGPWSVSGAWLDYDSDGLLDLFVVRYVAWDPAREPYCGTSTFGQYCHPRQYRGLSNALYRNLGGGGFRDVSLETGVAAHTGKGMGVAIGDYNQDGRLDVFVANDTEPNFLFRGVAESGIARFEEAALASGAAYNENGSAVSSMGAEFRDLDNDGFEDLFVTALTNETFPVFRNTGKGSFLDVTLPWGAAKPSLPWTGWSLAAADFNNDGWKDVFTANGHVMDNAELSSGRASRQPTQVYMNSRGRFTAATLPGEAFHRGLAHGDLDSDGRVDVVVTRLNQPAQVVWNRNGAGRWIAFRPRGTRSNRDGIGALIRIETEAGRQWNRMVTSNGYSGSSVGPVHFGVGNALRVISAEILWPSGARERREDLETNRVHEWVEAP